MSDVFHGKKDKPGLALFAHDAPSVQQHLPLPDQGEFVIHFNILKTGIFGKNGLQQIPEARDVPLPVAHFEQEMPDGLFGRCLEHREKGTAGRDDPVLGIRGRQVAP